MMPVSCRLTGNAGMLERRRECAAVDYNEPGRGTVQAAAKKKQLTGSSQEIDVIAF